MVTATEEEIVISFSDSDIPIKLHAYCRCWGEIVPVGAVAVCGWVKQTPQQKGKPTDVRCDECKSAIISWVCPRCGRKI